MIDANQEDIILVSDLDEIPNLSLIDLKNLKTKITVFEQNFFYYKFDLYIPNFIWYGTKVIKMKDFISPQWARNIKCKKYPKYRIDIMFNNFRFLTNCHYFFWHSSCDKSNNINIVHT